MTYTTLTYNGVEKSLADWGVATWRREVYNQASDSFGFDLVAATDAAGVFPFGGMILIQIQRTPGSLFAEGVVENATLPVSGCTSWTGGTKWFVGWRVSDARVGSAALEGLEYKFAGPWDFFFERLVYQKLWLTWNGSKQIADWRSQVVLGLSVTGLTSSGDTVTGSTSFNYLTLAQQLVEIAQYAAAQSSYEQTVNGPGWPAGPQFAFDNLTTDANGNYQLKNPARTNCTIPDFLPGYEGSNNDIAATTSGLILRAPLDAVNDMTCAECMRRMLRWIGGIGSPVTWWDYTTTPPTLKISTVDQLSARTLALVGSTEKLEIQRRDDLIPSAVAFKYRISGQVNGSPYTVIENDVAATVDGTAVEGVGQYGALTSPTGGGISSDAQTELPLQARRFSAQVGTFDFEGTSLRSASATIATAALNLNDPSSSDAAMGFWTSLFPELAATTGLAFYNGGNPAPTVADSSGTPINTANYPNILVDGQFCPWMYVNNTPTGSTAGAAIEATIKAYFTYSESATPPSGGSAVNTGTTACHEKTVKVKLTNLSSGNFQSQPQGAIGEPIPYGLPGYIYAIEKIPQYQGKITFAEQEITDVCPMGNCLNLSGGLAEWSTMRACVQQIRYDDKGGTTLVFGPAEHLGSADLVERLRVNRGPRWFYLIGNDVLNQDLQTGPTELGKNLPKQSPSPGNKIPNWQLVSSNLPDLQSHLSSYTLAPGVSVWGKGQAPSGFSVMDGGPGMLIGDGSAGTQNAQWIKISWAQLQSITAAAGVPVQFYELNTCEDGDSTYYRTFLCTDKYHHS